MSKKLIVVPKDKAAEDALNFDEATQEQLLQLNLTDEGFDMLFNNGVFKLINRTCDSNIDDYEDEAIIDKEKIKRTIDKLFLYEEKFPDPLLKEKIRDVRRLFEQALDKETGVYFYF